MEEESLKIRVGKSVISMFIGMAIGVIIAEVVANSLIEISFTPAFAIVFGIAFMLLGLALTWRIWDSVEDKQKRFFLLFFALLVFISGICSFLLEKNWTHMTYKSKIPMYSIVGVSLSFALTFSLTEFLNMGLCDRCCSTDFENNPLIGTKTQIYLIFTGSLVMGLTFGSIFGSLDVEDDSTGHGKFKENLLISIPLGAVIGGILGFLNQWIRSSPRQYYTWTPSRNDDI